MNRNVQFRFEQVPLTANCGEVRPCRSGFMPRYFFSGSRSNRSVAVTLLCIRFLQTEVQVLDGEPKLSAICSRRVQQFPSVLPF